MDLHIHDLPLTPSDQIRDELSVMPIADQTKRDRRDTVDVRMLEGHDVVKVSDVANSFDELAIFFEHLGFDGHELEVSEKIDCVPDGPDKVLKPEFRDLHASNTILGAEKQGNADTDLGKVEWVLLGDV
jgi:hypothetical protein